MPKTVGQQLKKARLESRQDLEQVFEDTHIRIKYLEALEADDFSAMPSPVQGRGFLRLYARHLGLDADVLLAELRQAEDSFSAQQVVKIPAHDDEDIVSADDDEAEADRTPAEESESLIVRVLRRIGIASASPPPVPAAQTEPAPEAAAAPLSVEDALAKPDDIPYEPSEAPDGSLIAFAKIGAILRERREMLSLTYSEVEQHTHVREHYLRALEAGDFDSLPSPVQTRGILSNYAVFLDLNVDTLLLRFADGLQARREERYGDEEGVEKKRKRSGKFPWRRFMAPDLFFGVGMIVLLIGFSVWGMGRIAAAQFAANVGATAPSISDVLLATTTLTPTAQATPTLVVNTPEPNVTAAAAAPLDETFVGVQLFITAVERTWMRVTVDGKVAFEGRVQAGGDFFYEGKEQIEILAGNAAALRVTYNQRDMGLLGSFGEVVNRIYAPNGILAPTATASPTITETPRTTPTPTLTPSPTPTNILLDG